MITTRPSRAARLTQLAADRLAHRAVLTLDVPRLLLPGR